MTADDLVRVTLGRIGVPHAAWAEGERVSLPRTALASAGLLTRITSDRRLDIPPMTVLPPAASASLRERAAFTDRAPRSARLPVSYQIVPGWARGWIATAIGRVKRRSVEQWARFPSFPLDVSADLAADLSVAASTRSQAAVTPVVLSHDIDSPEGLRSLIERFAPIEEEAGARSINFVVPCAWPVDEGIVRELRARGHEIGVHGFDHANRTPFSADDERRRRLDAGRAFAEQYDAVGYRAPSLLRTRALLRDVGHLYRFDSSIPTSGGLFPVPNNGCATVRPFRVEGALEIPITLPRDGSLRFLGYAPRAIASLWSDCAARVARAGGVVMLLTHCERRFSGSPAMLDAYRQFLDVVRGSTSLAFRTAREVVACAAEAA